MKLIRGSELQDFLRCRLRWKYAWVEELKPKKINDKLFIGTLIHKWLEVLYETKSKQSADSEMFIMFNESDLSSMEQVEIDNLWDLAEKVVGNYYNHWKHADEKLEVVATELQFMIPLSDDTAYTGTIDLVYKDEYGNLWFMDHKTTASIDKYEKNSYMDRQISRYWWALQQLTKGNGQVFDSERNEWVNIVFSRCWDDLKEPFGFQYNLLLKDYPVKPNLLKKGGLSKAKNQKTSYTLYLRAINEHGLDESDYEDILAHLAEQEDRYFKRVTVHRTQQEIDASMQEFFATSNDIKYYSHLLNNEDVNDYPYDPIYRNITGDCQWDCQFKDICVAGMDGSDVDYLKEELFTTKEEIK